MIANERLEELKFKWDPVTREWCLTLGRYHVWWNPQTFKLQADGNSEIVRNPDRWKALVKAWKIIFDERYQT